MQNFLEEILPLAKKTISTGYYSKEKKSGKKKKSLAQAIRKAKTPVIAEVKPRSPSKGELIEGRNAEGIMREYAANGACAISVLTEPVKFGGKLKLLEKDYGIPLLQKDFIIDEKQMSANADAVLLIAEFCKLAGVNVNELVEKAHAKGLEVLLEVHSLEEFEKAMKTKADVIGINNRNLETLETSIQTTIDVLKQAKKKGKLVVSESGIYSRADVEKVLKAGADSVLVGTSLMQSTKPEEKLKELVG
ncbi:indole-3-glycerol-phosphate synthase [Candidatus Micrarchaeota archaeon]|nr:indole-3-glycerol-phosphate synthase [Candidatus Micrarchaeota archaeon]